MRTWWVVLVSTLLVTSCVAADDGDASVGAVVGRWDALPVPPTPDATDKSSLNRVYDIGVDDGGIVYVLANGTLHYWDGARFTKALGSEMTVLRPAGFVGDAKRGLYLVQRGDGPFQGRLYRVSDGEARFVTDFYCEDFGAPPQLYVSRSGRLICWGKRSVAWYMDGAWQRVETPRLIGTPQIFDTGDAVHVYYNGWMLTIDADGTAKMRESKMPITEDPKHSGPPQVHSVLWGNRTALLVEYGKNTVYAFTLPDGTPASTGALADALENRHVLDVFRGDNGSAWFYAPARTADTPYHQQFVVLKANGEILSADDTPDLWWQNIRTLNCPRSVLFASDGTLWIAEDHGDIAAYRDGTLTRFGWRHGIKQGCSWLTEGPRGEIYAGLKHEPTEALHVFRSGKPPEGPPDWTELWHEHELAFPAPVLMHNDEMWACLADHPGKISHWDGRAWIDTSVPFNTRNVDWILPDDQGHLIVSTRGPRPHGHLVGTDAVTGYDYANDAIVAAVRKGARRFASGFRAPFCVAAENGAIWLAFMGQRDLQHFDGERWGSFRFESEVIMRLGADETHDVVVCMRSGKRFGYNQGQFAPLPDGTPLPGSTGSEPVVFPCTTGGHWVKPESREPLTRSFGGGAFVCDFAETPFLPSFSPRLVFEDRAGNLWIGTLGTRRQPRVFMKDMSGFSLTAGALPERVSRSMSLDVSVLLDDKPQDGWRLFCRLDGGEWQGGEPAPKLTIELPEDGTYEVEVIGMGPLGGRTPESVKFTVKSKAE